MNREEFIKRSALLAIATTLLPSYSFSPNPEGYTRAQLIGKGNPDIIGDSYTSKMHKEARIAFNKMKAAAAEENFSIEIISAYRSFSRQKEIFEGKYLEFTAQGLRPTQAIEKIIDYSTIPGTSRHHWGTDLDLIDATAPRPKDVLVADNFHGVGPYCKFKEWLNAHAETFGFFEVYTNNPSRKGFKYEPWHFSYAPVSIPMLQAYSQLDVKQILLEEKIKGAEYFTDNFIATYRAQNIMDINPQLLT